ncbi:MAG: hypothetical protein ACI8W9_001460 [Psychromonas sp.]
MEDSFQMRNSLIKDTLYHNTAIPLIAMICAFVDSFLL